MKFIHSVTLALCGLSIGHFCESEETLADSDSWEPLDLPPTSDVPGEQLLSVGGRINKAFKSFRNKRQENREEFLENLGNVLLLNQGETSETIEEIIKVFTEFRFQRKKTGAKLLKRLRRILEVDRNPDGNADQRQTIRKLQKAFRKFRKGAINQMMFFEKLRNALDMEDSFSSDDD